jgi:hypothetical protein
VGIQRIGDIIFLIAYAIGINLLLVSFASLNIGISCGELGTKYNTTISVNESDTTGIVSSTGVKGIGLITSWALGRCEGLPSWIVWVFEIPVLVGLLFIIRSFIGAT